MYAFCLINILTMFGALIVNLYKWCYLFSPNRRTAKREVKKVGMLFFVIWFNFNILHLIYGNITVFSQQATSCKPSITKMVNTVYSLVIWSYPVFFVYAIILIIIIISASVASKARKEGYYAAAGPKTCAGKFYFNMFRNVA